MKKKIITSLLIIIFMCTYAPIGLLNELISSYAITDFWEYNFTGNVQTWTVPYTGYYRIDCYGAQGGTGGIDGSRSGAYVNGGSGGTLRASVVKLQKGTKLSITVGNKPSNGWSSIGEGSTNGEKWYVRKTESTGGYQTYLEEACIDRNGEGSQGRYRGYPDGAYGGEKQTFCDSVGSHSGGAVGGGGGGSSFVSYNGTKIISAKGGNGGTAHYVAEDGSGTAGGGTGGGVTTLNNIKDLVIWDTNQLNTTTEGTRGGNGYIAIRLLTPYPDVTITANTKDITRENVLLTATASDPKAGLPQEPYSWESADRTAQNTYEVSHNGTYTVNVINNEGNSSDASITINNIDKLSPNITNISQQVSQDYKKATITVTAIDEQTTQFAASGISGYALTKSTQVPSDFQDSNIFTVTENGIYYAWAKDGVGNISQIDISDTSKNSILVKDLEIEILGNIQWNDQDNKYNSRKSAELKLYKKLENQQETLVDTINIIEGQTNYSFKTRQRDNDGNIYSFRVEQTTLDGYETIYTETENNSKNIKIEIDNNLILPEYNTQILIEPINSLENKLLKDVDVKITAKIEETTQSREQVGAHNGIAILKIDSKFILDKNSINIIFEDASGKKTKIEDYTLRLNTITTYVGETEQQAIMTAGTKITIEVYGKVGQIGQYQNNITYTGNLRDYRGKNTDINLETISYIENNQNVEYQIPTASIKIKNIDSITEKILTDATFTLYEWNGTEYVKKETITDDNNDGIYESNVYVWTPQTQGKYKIVEEGIPTYHKDLNFSMEYSLTELKQQNYTVTVDYDNKGYNIKYGKRNPDDFDSINGIVENEPLKLKAQIEKIDEETQELIQNETEFTIYEWNNTENQYKEYISYTNGQKVKMLRQEDKKYITDQWLYYTETNEGKYRIVETKAPEGYVANYDENKQKVVYDIDLINIIQSGNYNNQIVENESTLKIGNNNENKMTNKRVQATLNINVVDNQTKGKQQADATLNETKFGLYALEDIKHSDGKTTNYIGENGILYKKDQLIELLYTNEEGKVTIQNLECGKYYIKMLEAPKGYNIDNTTYEIDFSYQGENKETLEITKTIEINVKKQAFQLYKLKENQEVLANAGFSIYLIPNLSIVKENKITRVTKDTYILNDEEAKINQRLEGKQNSDGTYFLTDLIEYYYAIYYTEETRNALPGEEKVYHPYDMKNEQLVLNYENSNQGTPIEEIRTDNKGYLKSPELAYGEYIVIETSVPREYEVASSFIVKIEEDSRETQKLRFITDKDFETRVKVYIKDSKTNIPIVNKEAYFTIKNEETGRYITRIQWNGSKFVEYGMPDNPLKVGNDGYIITPMKLPVGKYVLEQIQAPEGYVVNGKEGYAEDGKIIYTPKQKIVFEIKSNTAYYMDELLGRYIIVVNQENGVVTGNIKVSTVGEYLNKVEEKEEKYEFSYEQRPVENVECSLFAKEDIYKQYDNKQIEYKKDEKVATILTNTEGKAEIKNIPIGKYYIKQTGTVNGFAQKEETQDIEINYEGQEVPIVLKNIETQEQRQKINIIIHNIDKETKEKVSGGEYALYTKDIINYKSSEGEAKKIEANTLIAKVKATENGDITYEENDIPLGNYYIKEITEPYGYLKTEETIEIRMPSTQEKEIKIETTQEKIKTPTKVNLIFKYGEEQVKDIEFTIKDKEGKEIASTKEEGIKKIEKRETGYYVENIKAGEYEIEEEKVPNEQGYVKIKKQEIQIKNVEEKQEIKIEQEVSKVMLKIIDEETKEKLKGVKIKIKDKEGKEIEEKERKIKIEEKEEGYYIERLPLEGYKIIINKEGYKEKEEKEEKEIKLKDSIEIQEYEKTMRKEKYDVSIEKNLKKVIINGKETEIETKEMIKIEVKESKIDTEEIELEYEIIVKNEGETEATIEEIKDTIPKGLKYEGGEEWKVENNIAKYEKKETIKAGESKKIKMRVKWENSRTNFGEKKNEVEIVRSSNVYGYREENERNNKATESTIIGVKTGEEEKIKIIQIIIITLTWSMTICLLAGIEIMILEKRK